MLTAETFAAVATCLAQKLDPPALGTALAALAPLISARAQADMNPPPQPTPHQSATPVRKSRSRRSSSRSKRKRAHSSAELNATPGTLARACQIFATDPRLSIRGLMSAAKCSCGTAILARRKVREEGVAKFIPELESSPKPDKAVETHGQMAHKPERAEVEANLTNKADLSPTALTRATEFLEHHLRPGPRMEIHVRAAAQIAKISPAVLERAAEDLIRRRYPGDGAEPVWSLP